MLHWESRSRAENLQACDFQSPRRASSARPRHWELRSRAENLQACDFQSPRAGCSWTGRAARTWAGSRALVATTIATSAFSSGEGPFDLRPLQAVLEAATTTATSAFSAARLEGFGCCHHSHLSLPVQLEPGPARGLWSSPPLPPQPLSSGKWAVRTSATPGGPGGRYHQCHLTTSSGSARRLWSPTPLPSQPFPGQFDPGPARGLRLLPSCNRPTGHFSGTQDTIGRQAIRAATTRHQLVLPGVCESTACILRQL